MPLTKSNPTRFKYKDYQNGVSDIKEEEEGDEDENKDKSTDDDKYDIDIEDDNDSDDGKNGLIKDRFKNQVKFYHGNKSPRSPSTPRGTSMTDIFSSTIQEKGIFGLYAGLGPKIVHASLSNAIVFASKEKFVLYTFAMMIYLQGKVGDKKLQKMTQKVAT